MGAYHTIPNALFTVARSVTLRRPMRISGSVSVFEGSEQDGIVIRVDQSASGVHASVGYQSSGSQKTASQSVYILIKMILIMALLGLFLLFIKYYIKNAEAFLLKISKENISPSLTQL